MEKETFFFLLLTPKKKYPISQLCCKRKMNEKKGEINERDKERRDRLPAGHNNNMGNGAKTSQLPLQNERSTLWFFKYNYKERVRERGERKKERKKKTCVGRQIQHNSNVVFFHFALFTEICEKEKEKEKEKVKEKVKEKKKK